MIVPWRRRLIDHEGKVLSDYKDVLAPPAEIEKLLEERDR